jgi:hypothetical protein
VEGVGGLSARPLTGGQPQAPQRQFAVRRQQTTLEVEATPLSLAIDNQPTRDALNLRTPSGLMDQGLSTWRQAGSRAIDQIVSEAHRLRNIGSGERNAIASIAAGSLGSGSIPDLQAATLPAPELQFTPKTVRLLWKTTDV